MPEWLPFVRFKLLFPVSLSAVEKKKKTTPHKKCLVILLIKK